LKTECSRKPVGFKPLGRREVVARFDGGDVTSDGGGLLLRELDARLGITRGFAACFTDHRNQDLIEHTVEDLVAQRVFGLALGYEDLNDHDALRHDPMLALIVGKTDPHGDERLHERDRGKALAGKSTLNRLELTPSDADSDARYKKIVLNDEMAADFFVDAFLASYESAPEDIILDLDATDDPIHGNQEGRFFHGYYKAHCYLPLYIFCGEHLLCATLRTSDIDAPKGSVEELTRIIGRIRKKWSKTAITIRADSGFCREWLMAWCEDNGVEYVLGIARNTRLQKEITSELAQAKAQCEQTGEPARVFKEFSYITRDSWSRERRVIAKAEHLPAGSNPRFIVTNKKPEDMGAKALYEQTYCARGDMENRIKEQQSMLFADRTSTHFLRSNQIRLWFSSLAYVLMSALRRTALHGTPLAHAQCDRIRLTLLKIGAQIRVTVRKVWVSLSESTPYRDIWTRVWMQLASVVAPA